MSIYRIIECDVCGKTEKLDNPYREEWFIENICHTICSEECFKKSIKMDDEKIKRGKKTSRQF